MKSSNAYNGVISDDSCAKVPAHIPRHLSFVKSRKLGLLNLRDSRISLRIQVDVLKQLVSSRLYVVSNVINALSPYWRCDAIPGQTTAFR